jgi:O-antigen ligase
MLGKELRNAQSNLWLNYAIGIDELRGSVDQILAGKFRPSEDLGPAGRERGLAAVAALLAMLALVLTQTRSAWLGWLAGAAMIALLWKPRSLLLVPVLALLVFGLAPGEVRARMRSFSDANDTTFVERSYMWRAGLALWRDHPLLGVGPDNLRAVYPRYKLEDDPWLPERAFTHLHDNPLQIAGERGGIGLAAWIWIWLAWAALAVRAWRRTRPEDRSQRALIAGAGAALLGFHLAGLFEYNFGDSEVVTLLWIVLAMPLAAARLRRGDSLTR